MRRAVRRWWRTGWLVASGIALLPGTGYGQAAEEYAFVVRVGADTFAVENVSRTPGRMEAAST